MSSANSKTYTINLDLNDPHHLKVHELIQRELKSSNAPLVSVAESLGKRAKSRLNKPTDVS